MTIRPLTSVIAAGAVLALATTAQAQAKTEFCGAVTAITAAAQATPTWNGVARGDAGTVVPGPFRACITSSYSSSADYHCSLDLTASTVDAAYRTLVSDLAACFSGTPSVSGDDISTYTTWTTASGIEVSATKVTQANADNFGIGFGVRLAF